MPNSMMKLEATPFFLERLLVLEHAARASTAALTSRTDVTGNRRAVMDEPSHRRLCCRAVPSSCLSRGLRADRSRHRYRHRGYAAQSPAHRCGSTHRETVESPERASVYIGHPGTDF